MCVSETTEGVRVIISSGLKSNYSCIYNMVARDSVYMVHGVEWLFQPIDNCILHECAYHHVHPPRYNYGMHKLLKFIAHKLGKLYLSQKN